MGEDRKHARCVLGGSGVDRYSAAIRDRAVDDRGMGGALDGDVCRILGRSRHLERTIDPGDRTDFERNVSAVRASLSEDEFAAVWAEGRAMTLEQAVAYALEQGVEGNQPP